MKKMEIQRMSITEKIAALSPGDKAFVKSYIERAILKSSIQKLQKQRKKLNEE